MISIPMEKIPNPKEGKQQRELLCSSQKEQGEQWWVADFLGELCEITETSIHIQPPEHSGSNCFILSYGKLAATEARERNARKKVRFMVIILSTDGTR